MFSDDRNLKLVGVCVLFISLSITFGAIGSHFLENKITEKGLSVFNKSNYYLGFQSLALIVVSSYKNYAKVYIKPVLLKITFFGIIVFCISLYAVTLSYFPNLIVFKKAGIIAPFGGIAMITGWILIGFQFIRSK